MAYVDVHIQIAIFLTEKSKLVRTTVVSSSWLFANVSRLTPAATPV